MKQTLVSFGLKFDHIPVYQFHKNPVQYSRTKHIEIMHYFIRDHIQKGDVLDFMCTSKQLADIFMKPLSANHFFAI